jgi:hypothetical protein
MWRHKIVVVIVIFQHNLNDIIYELPVYIMLIHVLSFKSNIDAVVD